MEMTKILGRAGAGMASAGNSMKRTAANTKLDGKIVDAEKTISAMTREIGNLTVIMLDGDRTVGPDIKERYEAIVAARKLIAETEGQKEYRKVLCPHCGKKTTAGMHYCGWCGNLINEEVLTA